MTSESTAAGHYLFLLPPGWVRLDLRGDVERQVAHYIGRLLRGAPRDKIALLRDQLFARFASAVREASAGGALELVVPVPFRGGSFRSSFVIHALPRPSGIDPIEELGAIAASDSSARLVDIEGLVALRTENIADRTIRSEAHSLAVDAGIDPASVDALKSRRVQYFLGHPDHREDWITVLFSTPIPAGQDGDEWSQAETMQFDAIMRSVRLTS